MPCVPQKGSYPPPPEGGLGAESGVCLPLPTSGPSPSKPGQVVATQALWALTRPLNLGKGRVQGKVLRATWASQLRLQAGPPLTSGKVPPHLPIQPPRLVPPLPGPLCPGNWGAGGCLDLIVTPARSTSCHDVFQPLTVVPCDRLPGSQGAPGVGV